MVVQLTLNVAPWSQYSMPYEVKTKMQNKNVPLQTSIPLVTNSLKNLYSVSSIKSFFFFFMAFWNILEE